jgi:hypothetical protein
MPGLTSGAAFRKYLKEALDIEEVEDAHGGGEVGESWHCFRETSS